MAVITSGCVPFRVAHESDGEWTSCAAAHTSVDLIESSASGKDTTTAHPKRWPAGGLDRVDHLFSSAATPLSAHSKPVLVLALLPETDAFGCAAPLQKRARPPSTAGPSSA